MEPDIKIGNRESGFRFLFQGDLPFLQGPSHVPMLTVEVPKGCQYLQIGICGFIIIV